MPVECPICSRFFSDDRALLGHWLSTKKHINILDHIDKLQARIQQLEDRVFQARSAPTGLLDCDVMAREHYLSGT